MCTRLAFAVTLDGSSATQYSTALGGPGQAVDGNPSTLSCTDDTAGQPWWSIDLGDVYSIATVAITFPATGADTRKYHYTALCLNGSRQRRTSVQTTYKLTSGEF